MTISKLATKQNISPNTSGWRGNPSKITIHHAAGVVSADGLGWIFADPAREASCNYGIGNDGEIICILPEEYHPWTSSSWSNDEAAVTFEVSNSYAGDPWPISDAAWKSMIALAADICKRYGITPYYDGTAGATFTEHRMFAPTACPGDYIHARMQQIVKEVKAAMSGSSTSAEVQQWELGITNPNQRWHLAKNSDGTYAIKASNGMVLDVYANGKTSGTKVWVYKPNNTDAQKWKLVRVAKSPSGIKYDPPEIAPFEIIPLGAPNLRLDVKGASQSNGASIQLYKSNNTNAQRWVFLDTGDGYVRLMNCASGKVLDLKDGGN